jgi:uncharacterized protein (TIGR02996 family)
VDVAAAFLADILKHPGDDAPRLIFADWLEEHGDGARAEFIRVQCELEPLRSHGHGTENPHGGDCPTCFRAARLDRRERELLHDAVRWWAWLADLYGVTGRYAIGDLDHCSDDTNTFAVRFRRGFVAEIKLPCAAWEEHGPALVRAAPLTRVRLTDRTPNPVDGEHSRYYWWHRDLPAEVYRLMACDDAQPGAPRERPNWKRYPSLAAALAASSAACLAFAREPRRPASGVSP